MEIAETLYLIERLEDLQTEMQGMITPPYLSTTLLYDLSKRLIMYQNR